LYFSPAALSAGGAVWHAAQGFFSFAAIAGVAIDCPVVITIIAPASSIADTVAAVLVKTLCAIFGFRICRSPEYPIDSSGTDEIRNAQTIADGYVIEKA
jgi:hypothetical protein